MLCCYVSDGWKALRHRRYSSKRSAAPQELLVLLESSLLLYVYVGEDGGSAPISFDSVERYDPIRKKWSLLTPMTVPRCQVGAAVLDGLLFAVGGYNDLTDIGFTSSVEK